MSFYPILKAPGCTGWTTLYNFPPNNWETRRASEKYVSVSWSENDEWKSTTIGTIKPSSLRTIKESEVASSCPRDSLLLLSLSETPLPTSSKSLPKPACPATSFPAWRATLGLSAASASTSYQGEIDPFPEKGSLLTFGPFMQFADGIENFLVLVNVENSAHIRTSRVELFDSKSKELRGSFPCRSNSITSVSLDGLGFTAQDLPLVICRSMSAIPLYLAKTTDGSFLSLEHTHPPSCFVIRGDRWGVQRILKNRWFSETETK